MHSNSEQNAAKVAVVDTYIDRLHLSIDHALAISYRRDAQGAKAAFVAHISLVKGIPFYGFHVGYRFFLKIYLLNPLHTIRLSDLLRQGAVMTRTMQPYESHMQYIPQWMCDYNLYGCDFMDCAKVMFRSPVPKLEELADISHQWHDRSIPAALVSSDTDMSRQSHCELEVDVCVHDIVNRFDIKARNIHHDFTEYKTAFAFDKKLVHSMAGLWKDETRRRKMRMGLQDTEKTPFPPEVLVSVSADPRNSQAGGWIHEGEYRNQVDALALHEKEVMSEETGSFETFVHPHPSESTIKTTFESVDDLHPGTFHPNRRLADIKGHQGSKAHGKSQIDVDVDESRILSLPDDQQPPLLMENDSDMDSPERDDGNSSAKVHKTKAEDLMEVGAELTEAHPSQLRPSQGDSEELQDMGIRNTGDFSHVDEDAFDIPIELFADLSSTTSHQARPKRPNDLSDLPNKRRKLIPQALGSEHSPLRMNYLTVNGASDGVTLPPKDPANPRKRQTDKDLAGTSIIEKKFKKSKSNGQLNFTVVKDPFDPHTIQRLSQRSGNSMKSSSRGKVAGFDGGAQTTVKPDSHTTVRPEKPISNTTVHQLRLSCASPNFGKGLAHAFSGSTGPTGLQMLFLPRVPPPHSDFTSLESRYCIPSVLYQDAYYGNEDDVPERNREYAGRDFKLESTTVAYLPEFDPLGLGSSLALNCQPNGRLEAAKSTISLSTWEIGALPPTREEVKHWLHETRPASGRSSQDIRRRNDRSQIDAATQKNKHGFKYSQKRASTSVRHQTQYMSSMSLEVHVNTREGLLPNPEKDEVACIFWCFSMGRAGTLEEDADDSLERGVIVLSEPGGIASEIAKMTTGDVLEEETELDLLNRMIDVVREQDPDVLTGFEVHNGSWGYLMERARLQYEFNLCDEFSRTIAQSHGRFGREADRWGFNQTSTIRVTGRHMINIWRAMRSERNLLQYTMENIAFHTLHQRVPHYSFADLTKWYKSSKLRDLAKVLEYFSSRTRLDLAILDQNELIPRTSEQARLLGVDFFSVFSRGSQFKVESLMFRIAKPESLLLISPSRKQVGSQNALECLPLVMEPQSAFYTSPVLVLDFQSLYPSVMIAYNYCYSTFLGRVVSWRGSNKMGFTDFAREPGLLNLLKDHINIAPNGIIYTKPHVRKSLLAKMLGEILETRVMVKSGMKIDKDDKTLQRLLNNRQLALKLIANVTYGYTSASFSGRMPCSEIADSIVQTGRETLEKAIALIHSVRSWGAEVVYGDTDSLFVHLKGRTRDNAFDIGNQIAKAISDMNPRPVKLKFEKVYQPCVLLAKKRYVGFKYERKEQKDPEFEAKGIETVRRDGTPAEQKIEEKALKTLFRTADLSQVKTYFQKQCEKIMKGRVSIQDFCYAREVKLGSYSDKGPPPPGALISTRKMADDPRIEPQYGERVPYVVIAGAPGARLIDRCVAPEVLLQNDHHELDAEYYISKNIIPPLERIFNLVGANVRQWYDEMPKYQRIRQIEGFVHENEVEAGLSKKTLESFMKSSACIVCRGKLDVESPLCTACAQHPARSLYQLRSRLAADEGKAADLDRACRSCSGLSFGDSVRCDSKDCPVFYSRTRHRSHMNAMRVVIAPITNALEATAGESLEW